MSRVLPNLTGSQRTRHPVRHVGLDVHAATLAVAEPGGRVESLGSIPNRTDAVHALITKLSHRGLPLATYYEAGPCGYGLYRRLTRLGVPWTVVAPSLVPRRPGERVKIDRRDARKLASFAHSGLLTPVWVPDPLREALRDLVRAREDALQHRLRIRYRLSKFLLCYQLRRPKTRAWSTRHRNWLEQLLTSHPVFAAQDAAALARAATLLDYTSELDRLEDRMQQLEAALRRTLTQVDLTTRALLAAHQRLRGVAGLTATTLVAELGRLSRFPKPSQRMAYAGVVSREDSSGHAVRRDKITKCGNAHLRRVLVEAVWAYRHGPRLTVSLRARQIGQPEPIERIAWRAQQRLCRRYRRLLGRGKPSARAVVATARKLLGFIWAIGYAAECASAPPAAAAWPHSSQRCRNSGMDSDRGVPGDRRVRSAEHPRWLLVGSVLTSALIPALSLWQLPTNPDYVRTLRFRGR